MGDPWNGRSIETEIPQGGFHIYRARSRYNGISIHHSTKSQRLPQAYKTMKEVRGSQVSCIVPPIHLSCGSWPEGPKERHSIILPDWSPDFR